MLAYVNRKIAGFEGSLSLSLGLRGFRKLIVELVFLSKAVCAAPYKTGQLTPADYRNEQEGHRHYIHHLRGTAPIIRRDMKPTLDEIHDSFL
jgi:hypothetical protein